LSGIICRGEGGGGERSWTGRDADSGGAAPCGPAGPGPGVRWRASGRRWLADVSSTLLLLLLLLCVAICAAVVRPALCTIVHGNFSLCRCQRIGER